MYRHGFTGLSHLKPSSRPFDISRAPPALSLPSSGSPKFMAQVLARLIFLSLMLIGISACEPQAFTDTLAPDQASAPLVVGSGESFGQTFVPRHAGLQAISLFLLPFEANRDEQLTLHLRNKADLA